MLRMALLVCMGSALADTPRVLFTLERKSCFGWCPVYKVTVWSDGKLEYRGFQWVQRYQATAHLAPTQLDALTTAFTKASFLSRQSQRRGDADMPLTSLSFRGKRVTFRESEPTPAALRQLGDDIDKIVGIERFIGSASLRMEPAIPPQ